MNPVRIPETEMVAHFVAAEYNSARFSKITRKIVKDLKVPASFITHPNLNSGLENRARAVVLDEWRGYLSRTKLFAGFPTRVVWYRAKLTAKEMQNLHYGHSPKYWSKLSYGTHRVEDGVRFIFSMPKSANPARFVRSILKGIGAGEKFPPIIALTDPGRSKLVLIEGSARSTAHYKAIAEGKIKHIDAIIGVSGKISTWEMWVP